VVEVPIEFTIQNILNFTLSPINDDVVLDIKPMSLIGLWKEKSQIIFNGEDTEKNNNKNKKTNTKNNEKIKAMKSCISFERTQNNALRNSLEDKK
jgi:hypothetical protein